MPRLRGSSVALKSNGDLPRPSSAFSEKREPWTRPLYVPVPGVRTRRLRIPVPNIELFFLVGASRLGRRRGPLFICIACIAVGLTFYLMKRGFGGSDWTEQWPTGTPAEPPTLVFRREDLQRIWKWEIESGHYPSYQPIPKEIGFQESLENPAIPYKAKKTVPSRFQPPPSVSGDGNDTETIGTGHKRVYLDIQSLPPDVAYPPRPVPGSVADMDIIMKHCDFSKNKYVRDCLEILRLGGGLDNGQRVRRGSMDDWKYIYLEQLEKPPSPGAPASNAGRGRTYTSGDDSEADEGFVKKKGVEWETQVVLPSPLEHRPYAALPNNCDPDNPRLYHMFWTGPFTDKPYLALLSFLFTQNTALHLKDVPKDYPACRPQFWLWINPGPAASVPNPSALKDMFESLKSNPWASPFLHPRFKDVIQFKLWNTTEQLDGVPEIKEEWRALQESLFNSGGHIIHVKKKPVQQSSEDSESTESGDDMLNRLGSKSSDSYDRLSVILSDMARFVLCHRFGGIYLDADTILLRDWEEIWGWKGAFAYRWSRLEKYNTAVLRMNKGSALGTFLFRTALKNGLDFHPMTVSRYAADAKLEGLLLRLPDALFDSAWLNTEYYQRDRPPQPYFQEFADFFDTPAVSSAAPQALGFNGFFRGAYSYHFHNFWWKPFDPARNFPDLGPRFSSGEALARAMLTTSVDNGGTTAGGSGSASTGDRVEDDKRDLDWATVLKRTFEAYIRGERPNAYGEWLNWG